MMAAPVGHLYLAIQILSGPLCEVKERDFLIGTLFPDIRYPAQIARELTHKSHVTWQEIINEKDPFMQGILFHSFVDEKREEYIRKNGLYNLLPKLPHASSCLKGTEDILLLKKIKDNKVIRYLDEILEHEKHLVSNESIIKDWHTALQNYFFYGPTPQTIRPLIRDSIPELGKLKAIAEIGASYGFKFETYVISLDQNLTNSIMKFYENFEQLFLKNVATLDR